MQKNLVLFGFVLICIVATTTATTTTTESVVTSPEPTPASTAPPTVGDDIFPYNFEWSNVTQNGIEEALKFSNVTVGIIEEYLAHKLPAAALPEGERILSETRAALVQCEALVQSIVDVWQYKVCSSSELRNALAALSELTMRYRPLPSSGVRLKLFLC